MIINFLSVYTVYRQSNYVPFRELQTHHHYLSCLKNDDEFQIIFFSYASLFLANVAFSRRETKHKSIGINADIRSASRRENFQTSAYLRLVLLTSYQSRHRRSLDFGIIILCKMDREVRWLKICYGKRFPIWKKIFKHLLATGITNFTPVETSK